MYSYHSKPVSVIICVGEGWFLFSDTLSSLLSYSSQTLLVEELDIDSYRLFARELLRLKNKSIEIELDKLYREYTGGTPGSLISITSIGLSKWINSISKHLSRVLKSVSKKLNIDIALIKEFIKELPKEIDYTKT